MFIFTRNIFCIKNTFKTCLTMQEVIEECLDINIFQIIVKMILRLIHVIFKGA